MTRFYKQRDFNDIEVSEQKSIGELSIKKFLIYFVLDSGFEQSSTLVRL